MGEAHASLAVEAHVGVEQITVKLELHDISQALYQRMLNARPALNETTIPEAILAYMEEEGLEDVYYKDPELSFDNASRTVKASFTLAGRGLVDFSYNRTTMARTYEVEAGWRKADVEVREGGRVLLKLNFSSYFGLPLGKWQVVGYGGREALFLNSTTEDELDPVWYFVLPKGARLVRASGDKFTFELPATFMDKFLASPFWPFLAVVAAILVAISYRKAAVRLVRP
ncbi:hypothetical protein DRO32_01540, partial [Candidatus Bathyarchaeota archaeon]